MAGEGTSSPFFIRIDDCRGEQTSALLALHLAGMHANSPPDNVFALDLSGLQRADVTVWSAWMGERIAGIGALRQLSADHGEIKSMRTHPDFLRRGVGQALLDHILSEAARRAITRLSLETGSGPAFEPAIALYLRNGFASGPAFGEYVKSDFNQFLHRAI